MQLEELQSVRDRERQTDKLQQLRETFYADAGEFIQQLRTERDRAAERADDPFDAPEVNRLTDEINTAEQTVEAIYEKRVGKIVKAASFAAADLPAEADGMTAEEQDLFDQLVADIKQNRQHVLDVLAGDAPTDAGADGSPSPSDEATATPSAPDEHSPTPDPASATGEGATPDPSADTPPPESAREPPAHEPADDQASAPPMDGDDGVAAADLMGGDDSPAEPSREPPAPPTETEAGELRNDGGDIEAKTDSSSPSAGPAEPAPATGATDSPGPESSNTGGDTRESGARTAAPPSDDSGGDPAQPVDRTTVRITDDVDTFLGFDDRDYDLARDDVVTLPEANAEILLDRNAAEQL